MKSKWIVILFDEEEMKSSCSVMATYGPFDSEDAAKSWAQKKYSELSKTLQGYRGFSVESVESSETYSV